MGNIGDVTLCYLKQYKFHYMFELLLSLGTQALISSHLS